MHNEEKPPVDFSNKVNDVAYAIKGFIAMGDSETALGFAVEWLLQGLPAGPSTKRRDAYERKHKKLVDYYERHIGSFPLV